MIDIVGKERERGVGRNYRGEWESGRLEMREGGWERKMSKGRDTHKKKRKGSLEWVNGWARASHV